MELKIKRFAYAPQGTFGELIMPDGQRLYSVEQPWRQNERNISCIPEGKYLCVPREFFSGGYDAIHITNVPDRTHILFHRGNNQADVAGCIAVGMQLGWVDRLWSVSNSKQAFEILMSHFGGVNFELTITGFSTTADDYIVRAEAEIEPVSRSKGLDWSPIPGFLDRHGVITEAESLSGIRMEQIDLSTPTEP